MRDRRLKLDFGFARVQHQINCPLFTKHLVKIIMNVSCHQLIIHETLRAVVAQYNASQLITQRENVSREIRKILTERAANFNIALDDVSITSLTFGKEFTTAIEAKQVAAQEAERAKYIVEKAEINEVLLLELRVRLRARS